MTTERDIVNAGVACAGEHTTLSACCPARARARHRRASRDADRYHGADLTSCGDQPIVATRQYAPVQCISLRAVFRQYRLVEDSPRRWEKPVSDFEENFAKPSVEGPESAATHWNLQPGLIVSGRTGQRRRPPGYRRAGWVTRCIGRCHRRPAALARQRRPHRHPELTRLPLASHEFG
jgi:hypothetical protein